VGKGTGGAYLAVLVSWRDGKKRIQIGGGENLHLSQFEQGERTLQHPKGGRLPILAAIAWTASWIVILKQKK